jgi:hypothetical protein
MSRRHSSRLGTIHPLFVANNYYVNGGRTWGQFGGRGGLYQTVDQQGNIRSSCIIGHDFPGRRGMIRVDSHSAISTDGDGCVYGGTARRLQNQLVSGSRLITRRVEWPYDSNRDKEILISGGYYQPFADQAQPSRASSLAILSWESVSLLVLWFETQRPSLYPSAVL